MRALVKLEQVLPAHLRRRVQAIGQATQTLQVYGSGPTVDPQCLTTLAAAVRDHERVRFAYTARDQAAPSARSSRIRWSTPAAAGTWWPGTPAARTGARSASTGSRRWLDWRRFHPRTLPADDAAAFVQQGLRPTGCATRRA